MDNEETTTCGCHSLPYSNNIGYAYLWNVRGCGYNMAARNYGGPFNSNGLHYPNYEGVAYEMGNGYA